VVKATDGEQNLVWDAVRKPFGEREVTTAQVEIPLGFPGQYYDQETGNYYNYFRDYDPSTGRYLQSDPIGLGGGLNTYLYASANPILFVDPTGENPASGAIWGGNIGTGIGAVGGPAGAAIGRAVGSVVGAGIGYGIAKMCEDNDDCEPLYKEIDQLVKLLKKRYWEMRADKNDLFNTRPSGTMSWDGHQQQFTQVQRTLRRVLNEADSKGCTAYRSDAWSWATKPPPSQPAPR
jgi:RHS repeat-associated protein